MSNIQPNTRISNIDHSQLRLAVYDRIVKLLADYDQKITDDAINHIVGRVLEQLKSKYSYWLWIEFIRVLEAGLNDRYGKTLKVTVRNLSVWFYEYQKIKFDTSRYKNDQDHQQNRAKEKNAPFLSNHRRGSAINLRMEHNELYTKFHQREVAEMIEQGLSVNEMLKKATERKTVIKHPQV